MNDIEESFRIIEEELLSSMFRNLNNHIRDEVDLNMSYQMWQEQQLLSLSDFSKNNRKYFTPKFDAINKDIEQYILSAYADGENITIREIESFKINKIDDVALYGMFNKLNENKLRILIDEIVGDFKKAEFSVLRNTDDAYRKIISTSQIYLNSGAGTLRQAIDMSTRDFLAKGIGAIQYSNGSVVGISTYSNMALRTADTRAYLAAAGKVRDEYGLNLVYVHSRGTACPKCIKYINKIYNDDVYSSNDKYDSRYPKLSDAIANGLYHPNCKDSHSTYYGDMELPKEVDKEEAIRVYNLQQQQRYNERNIRKYKRMGEYSLDDENKRKYQTISKTWQKKQRDLIDNNPELRRDYFREKINYI